MSSSYRKLESLRFAIAAVTALIAAAPIGAAQAAQTYIQPQVDVRVEGNDNFDVVPNPGDDSDVYGYIADLQALFGIATPRGETSVRPRIRLQEYPDRDDISGFEGFFDLRSKYRWETSNLLFVARYSHQDLYNAELPRQVFDPLDPNYGSDAEAGRSVIGEIRDRFSVTPTYTYQISDRLRLGAEASYDLSRYNTDLYDDYDYWRVGGFGSWSLSERTDLGLDAYASYYETTEEINKTDAYGVGASFVHRYSENTGIEGRLFLENNDVENFVPVRTTDSESGVGGYLSGYVKGEVTQWRFTVEQGFWPTGDGGKKETSQFRAQYFRDLTQRLRFNGTGRYFRERAIGSAEDDDDRDYARAELSLRYLLSATWYVSGGYAYTWQEYVSEADAADNNQLFLSFGYIGRGRPYR